MRLGIKHFGYTPEELLLDIFPFVTNSGDLKAGEEFSVGTPIVKGDAGLEAVTAETIDNIIGIAAEDTIELPEDDPVLVYYETGGFHADRLALPENVALEKLEPVLRKLCIFIR